MIHFFTDSIITINLVIPSQYCETRRSFDAPLRIKSIEYLINNIFMFQIINTSDNSLFIIIVSGTESVPRTFWGWEPLAYNKCPWLFILILFNLQLNGSWEQQMSNWCFHSQGDDQIVGSRRNYLQLTIVKNIFRYFTTSKGNIHVCF